MHGYVLSSTLANSLSLLCFLVLRTRCLGTCLGRKTGRARRGRVGGGGGVGGVLDMIYVWLGVSIGVFLVVACVSGLEHLVSRHLYPNRCV